MASLAVLAGFLAVFAWVGAHSLWVAIIAAVIMVGLAVAAWLWRTEAGTSHWEALERNVRDGRVIVYWRPGCPSCYLLRLTLGARARAASWVDIWADDEAAAFVRDVNDGVESVPTVILGDGSALTNPTADDVATQLAS